MKRRPFASTLLVFGLALSAGACGSSDLTSLAQNPVQPTPATVTDAFEGVIERNGAATFPFVIGAASTVSATISGLDPGDATLGISLGTWNGQDCSAVLTNDSAVQGTVIVGVTSAQGNLCVRVYDVGRLAGPTGYSVQITHQ